MEDGTGSSQTRARRSAEPWVLPGWKRHPCAVAGSAPACPCSGKRRRYVLALCRVMRSLARTENLFRSTSRCFVHSLFAVICSGKCRNTCFPAESTRSYARLETQSSECSWRGLTAPILEIRILTASGNLTDGFKVAWGHFEVNDGENKSCEYLKAKKSPRARFKGMSLNSGFPSSVTRLIPPLTRYGGGYPAHPRL